MTPTAYLTAHAGALPALLRRLVAVQTVNPPGRDYATMSALLAAELSARGLKTRRLRVPDRELKQVLPAGQHAFPRYNVLGLWRVPGAKQTVHFNAHYDVVPVGGDWRHGDAFSGAVERDWIYGRGTADMKGSIAALLLALEALRATGTTPRVNVEVSFTADEETDSTLGTGWVASHGKLRADYAVVGEGGEGDGVCCGHNGVVWLNVRVHGRAAHGSTPEAGINALEKMSALVLALNGYKQLLARRTFRAPDGRRMHPTINLGGVFASGEGGKVNTVPAAASFSIDRRVLPIESVRDAERELRAWLKAAAKKIPSCRITIEKISDNHSCYTAPAHPLFAAMRSSVARVRRRPAKFTVSTGFNDMHYFASVLKLPTLGHGPSGLDYHAVDERARLKDLTDSAKIYADLLTTFKG